VKAILADMTISISEFKANPNKAVQDADGVPFCVLTNNAPAFYVVSPE
jgi:PHD/YefM family antitoxin component YafN of YafNO toxin-antitoxin module